LLSFAASDGYHVSQDDGYPDMMTFASGEKNHDLGISRDIPKILMPLALPARCAEREVHLRAASIWSENDDGIMERHARTNPPVVIDRMDDNRAICHEKSDAKLLNFATTLVMGASLTSQK
jgi:hypothetical protein